jgi:hypothetical protein
MMIVNPIGTWQARQFWNVSMKADLKFPRAKVSHLVKLVALSMGGSIARDKMQNILFVRY